MPFFLLYLFSDLLGFLLRRMVRYRAGVIRENLLRSFPEKGLKEIKSIEKQYYQNLADVTLEVIKLSRISSAKLKKRFTFTHLDLLEDSLRNNRSVLVAIGHCGNWEWMGTTLGLVLPYKGFALTKPLANAYYDEYMTKVRHRLNPDSTIPFKNGFRTMVKRRDVPSFYVIAADQTPTRDEATYWTSFLHQDTPFFLGIEKIARSLDFDVVFMDIRRTGRGHYEGFIQRITDRPKQTPEEEITQTYIHMLQEAIRQNPPNWLWSHRRWKHSRHIPQE